jgi:gamma-glutamyltranspeptidase/glutathione hydrolase
MDDFAPVPGQPNAYGLVQGEANAVRPGAHPLSSMTPTILVRDGKFYMSVGTPGGPTIINSVLQVIANVVDFGMNSQEAVNQPRIHHQWLPDELRMERGFSPDTVELLKSRGHQIKTVASMGEVAVIRSADGWLEGAADPRTEATAKGY